MVSGIGATESDSPHKSVEGLFPNESKDPTVSTLKSLVEALMSRKNEFGQSNVPSPTEAMYQTQHAIEDNPQLASAAVVKSLTSVTMHNGEPGNHDPFAPTVRDYAQKTLTNIVENRPELADATLTKNVTIMAASDPDSRARLAAQNTLATIAEKRPDLIDPSMVKTLQDTVAGRVHFENDLDWFDRGNGERVFGGAHSGKLYGNQIDAYDNKARATAQETLKTIAEKRPDLMATSRADNSLQNSSFSGRGAQASVIATPEQAHNTETSKPAIVIPKQSAPALHAAPPSPRPSF